MEWWTISKGRLVWKEMDLGFTFPYLLQTWPPPPLPLHLPYHTPSLLVMLFSTTPLSFHSPLSLPFLPHPPPPLELTCTEMIVSQWSPLLHWNGWWIGSTLSQSHHWDPDHTSSWPLCNWQYPWYLEVRKRKRSRCNHFAPFDPPPPPPMQLTKASTGMMCLYM